MSKYIKFYIIIPAIFLLLFSVSVSRADIQDDILTRQEQIAELQRQIAEYQLQIDESRTKSRTLENEIYGLNAKINAITLEIRSLELSINQTSSEIQSTEDRILEAEEKMSKHKNALGQFMQIAYENDQKSLTEIILGNDSISDFFNDLNSVRANQDNLRVSIDNIKDLKVDLLAQQTILEEKRIEFQQLKNLQEIEQRGLGYNKNQVATILKQTKGQESKFQELAQESQKDIETIRAQITYLEQNGVTAEEAVKFGQLAAIATGIRPAYLIAVLEIESGLGRNVGKCNRAEDPPSKGFRAIMKPSRDIEPFLQITAKLGLDPETTAVSCPQYINGRQYGWGGAMGPAQFIPSTWLGYEAEVSRIVGRQANPWNIEDAFTAAATKLARGGANSQSRTSEISASKAYYSGNSRCSTGPCNSYANAIQRKADDIERNL